MFKLQRGILLSNQVSTNRQHDGEGVRIWFDVFLRVKPLKGTERQVKSLNTILFMFGKGTCLEMKGDRIDVSS